MHAQEPFSGFIMFSQDRKKKSVDLLESLDHSTTRTVALSLPFSIVISAYSREVIPSVFIGRKRFANLY